MVLERRIFELAIATCFLAFPASGQSPCSTEQAQQFNFWIGDWDVTADGKVAGTNAITPILDGCVLQENWRGAGGGAGTSLNFFNPQLGKWQQFWVWRNGTTLYLTGEYADGKMTLEGTTPTKDGGTTLNRITWYDNEDGTVRQHWQISGDAGASWKDAFDGLYTPRE